MRRQQRIRMRIARQSQSFLNSTLPPYMPLLPSFHIHAQFQMSNFIITSLSFSLFFARNKTFMAQFEANKSKSIILYFFFAFAISLPFHFSAIVGLQNILDREKVYFSMATLFYAFRQGAPNSKNFCWCKQQKYIQLIYLRSINYFGTF